MNPSVLVRITLLIVFLSIAETSNTTNPSVQPYCNISIPQCRFDCHSNISCMYCPNGYNSQFNITYNPTTNTTAYICQPSTCNITNCLVCFNSTCLTCIDPYFFYNQLNQICEQYNCLLTNCLICKHGAKSCEKCSLGYAKYGWDGKCIKSEISECLQLYDWRGEQFRCLHCSNGNIPTLDQTQCMLGDCRTISDCQQCPTNNATCSTCRKGYSPSNIGQCIINPCNVSGCLYCSAVGICLRCLSTHTKINQSCVPIPCALPHCRSCKPLSLFCDECNFNFMLDIWTLECVPSTIIGCKQYSNLSEVECANCTLQRCQICAPFYFVDVTGTMCQTNCSIANCSICDSFTTCFSCSMGLIPDLLREMCVLPCNVPNCSQCSASNNCSNCQLGFKLVNNSCVDDVCTIPNCFQCLSSAKCKICDPFYNTTADGGCISTCFVAHCGKCLTNATCSQCSIGHIKTPNLTCLAICSIPNCKVCSTPTTCLSCQQTYSLSVNSSSCLVTCTISNCLQCSSLKVCSSCRDGYSLQTDNISSRTICLKTCLMDEYLSNTTACKKCSSFDDNCQECGNEGCSKCIQTHIIQQNKCKPCIQIFTNCRTCQVQGCTLCFKGYFWNKYNKTCQLIDSCQIQNCQFCSGQVCSRCWDGFDWNGTACHFNCTKTMIYNGQECVCPYGSYFTKLGCVACANSKCRVCNSQICSVCFQGYFPLFDQCQSCSSNCIQCSNRYQCLKCINGYQLINQTCVMSSLPASVKFQCPIGCSQCYLINSTITCFELDEGFSYGIDYSIVRCDPSCRTCLSTDYQICITCYNGIAISGICEGCAVKDCVACPSNKYTCQECTEGNTLFQGQCRLCSVNCLRCDINGPDTCDDGLCKLGYTKLAHSLGNCIQCINGCATCSIDDFRVCTSCSFGFYLAVSKQCLSCSLHCSSCVDESQCITCASGFALVNKICQTPAKYPCFTMVNNSCTACYHNYNLINNTCQTVKCGKNCTQCAYSYFLYQGKCLSCPAFPNCLQCDLTVSDTCLKCVTGFYPKLQECFACPLGCLDCLGPTKCLVASEGYFIQKNSYGGQTGSFMKCHQNCKTCMEQQTVCTSCRNNDTLFNYKCRTSTYVSVNIIFTPFSLNSVSTALYETKALSQWNLIQQMIFRIIGLKDHQYAVISKLSFGSIEVTVDVSLAPQQTAEQLFTDIQTNLTAPQSDCIVLRSAPALQNFIPTEHTTQHSIYPKKDSNFNLLWLILIIGGIFIIIKVIHWAVTRKDSIAKQTREEDNPTFNDMIDLNEDKKIQNFQDSHNFNSTIQQFQQSQVKPKTVNRKNKLPPLKNKQAQIKPKRSKIANQELFSTIKQETKQLGDNERNSIERDVVDQQQYKHHETPINKIEQILIKPVKQQLPNQINRDIQIQHKSNQPEIPQKVGAQSSFLFLNDIQEPQIKIVHQHSSPTNNKVHNDNVRPDMSQLNLMSNIQHSFDQQPDISLQKIGDISQ